MPQLQPFYKQVQAHYDLSNDFFALFLDRSMTYSCAYFARPDMSLEDAQRAKIDLSLGKCGLPPRGSDGRRLTLLDIGCGWGSTALRAATTYHVDVIGLTLSRQQHCFARNSLGRLPSDAGEIDFRLEGWEEFAEPVDRIVSIGAFEHFRVERYPSFFQRCYQILPADGRMLLHTIVLTDTETLARREIVVRHEDVLFAKFIRKCIFPGGQLCAPQVVCDNARGAGFHVAQTQALGPHYARTLDLWAEALESRREDAMAITSHDVYEMYMHYLTGCAQRFRSGHIDVVQFTLVK